MACEHGSPASLSLPSLSLLDSAWPWLRVGVTGESVCSGETLGAEAVSVMQDEGGCSAPCLQPGCEDRMPRPDAKTLFNRWTPEH